MPAKLAAMINMKGGVGKTTLSFNLGYFLAEKRGKRVLLVDLDPQANATIVSTEPAAFEIHRQTKKTIADVFIDAFRAYGPIRDATPPPIDINKFLYSIYSANGGPGRFDLIPSELILSSVLRGMTLGPYDLEGLISDPVRAAYDYILIDCAPTYSSLTTVALNTAKAVIIPMIADTFGAYGTKLMKTVLEEHEHDFGITTKVVGVVFTMWDGNANQVQQSTEIVREWTAANVFTAKISKNEWYKVANGKRQPIWETSAHTKHRKEFEEFVDEFEKKA